MAKKLKKEESDEESSDDEEMEVIDLTNPKEKCMDKEEALNELYEKKKEEINLKCLEFEKEIENCKSNDF